MTPHEIDTILNDAEVQIGFGNPPVLAGSGFWPAVRQVKGDPELIDRFADRIAVIDRAAFDAWARLTIPIWIGTVLAIVGALVGLAFVSAAAFVPQWNGVVFLAGAGVLIGTTHGLGHLAVGFIGGIRFCAWFIGAGRPQPGVKTDYGTYLRATPRARAWMHASGATVTKLIPFLLIPASVALTTVPTWVTWTLLVVGVLQVVADVVWSTRSSDWAKYRREIQYRSTWQ